MHPGLFVFDCDRILNRLERGVQRFFRRFKVALPLEQAVRFVRRETERHAITERILNEHGLIIHAAIHKNMWVSVEDRAIEHGDLFNEVALLIFKNAHSLNRKGRAKQSTRLYAMTATHVWQRYNSPNRRRHRLNEQCHEDHYGVAIIRTEELAALKAEAKADMVWDCGYSECGLSVD